MEERLRETAVIRFFIQKSSNQVRRIGLLTKRCNIKTLRNENQNKWFLILLCYEGKILPLDVGNDATHSKPFYLLQLTMYTKTMILETLQKAG